MDWISNCLVALSMSIDAMCVNATNGINEQGIKWWKLVLIGLIFGIFQFVMPTIGYFLGYSFKDVLSNVIPYIAFALLLLLAIKSFIEWLKDYLEAKKEVKNNSENIEITAEPQQIEEKKKKISFWNVMFQAVATSIDALCIGFTYIGLSILDAMLVFIVIGVTTFILSSLTGLFGKQIGSKIQKFGSLIAAIVFLGLAIKTLVGAFI